MISATPGSVLHDRITRLSLHLPLGANKLRSVDSLSRSRPTFNLQLLSQRDNFSTTSPRNTGGRGQNTSVESSLLIDWLSSVLSQAPGSDFVEIAQHQH